MIDFPEIAQELVIGVVTEAFPVILTVPLLARMATSIVLLKEPVISAVISPLIVTPPSVAVISP